MASGFSTPILFLIFNRPDTTAKVWGVIRSMKPNYLYVAADGPRPSRPEDIEKSTQTRAIIQPDWECELVTLYRDENLGCRNAVSQAITWFFDQVEEGLILEDDCLPDPSFFTFCQTLLARYRHEPKVMHIGGCNFQDGKKRGEGSYYFSKYNHIWGWATWRRAWRLYDVEIGDFPQVSKQKAWKDVFFNGYEKMRWNPKFQSVYEKSFDTWDYQWTYTVWKNVGLAITPQVNLISNIGFDDNATHTISSTNLSYLPTVALNDMVYADLVSVDLRADKYTFLKFQCVKPISKLKFYLFEVLALFGKL